jgi:hypothetical protein
MGVGVIPPPFVIFEPMRWNYRIMTLDGGKTFEIHEVYYTSDGKLSSYTENATSPTGDSITELMGDLTYMMEAFNKPILTPQDFPGFDK